MTNAVTDDGDAASTERRRFLLLCLTAVGVVYGDIGTSPIYAVRESLHLAHGVGTEPANVLGVLSLIFWSLILVISIKYLFLVMRADNRGEGGIIALTALVTPPSRRVTGRGKVLVMVGLFGAALLYGDSMITPAISVLSAVEGLEVATPLFEPYVLPITIGILVLLFSSQRHGTARVGAVFGPVMVIWFTTLAILGVGQIVQHPGVMTAVNPWHAISFFQRNGLAGVLVLGSVFLVVTGGEALYADMGHFGTRPIRLSWFTLVLPALLLNYFGQGALIITRPEALEQPFFLMAPRWALYPLVLLTTAATIIASQAVISGAFSLTRQAVQLGYLPRMRITHTSVEQLGQIYMPAINWILMIACIGLVLGFRSSSSLAAAYGVAVTTDMVFTSILFAVVAGRRWGWPPVLLVPLIAGFLTIDLGFWTANLPKVPHGGWFALLVAAVAFTVMTTWKRGRELLLERLQERVLPIATFVDNVRSSPPHRVPGTAVFLVSAKEGTPPSLLHNIKHNWVLHERTVFLTVTTLEIPYVHPRDRFAVVDHGEGLFSLNIRVGFAEGVDVPELLTQSGVPGGRFHPMMTSYFLGRERIISAVRPGMARWRDRLFSVLARNALGATVFFKLPPNRVVELGMQVEI